MPSQLQQKESLLPPNLEYEEQEMDDIRPLNLGQEEEMEEDLEQGQEEEVSNLEKKLRRTNRRDGVSKGT